MMKKIQTMLAYLIDFKIKTCEILLIKNKLSMLWEMLWEYQMQCSKKVQVRTLLIFLFLPNKKIDALFAIMFLQNSKPRDFENFNEPQRFLATCLMASTQHRANHRACSNEELLDFLYHWNSRARVFNGKIHCRTCTTPLKLERITIARSSQCVRCKTGSTVRVTENNLPPEAFVQHSQHSAWGA